MNSSNTRLPRGRQRRRILAVALILAALVVVVCLWSPGGGGAVKDPSSSRGAGAVKAPSSSPTTDLIQEALVFIRRDAEYIMNRFPGIDPAEAEALRGFALANAIMNYVQSRVSSTQYYYIWHADRAALPKTVEECLAKHAGICGHHAWVFLTLAKRLALPARGVEFYWTGRDGAHLSHATVEVKYGGKWRFFDVSWGTFFAAKPGAPGSRALWDILSIDEVRALDDIDRHRITNEAVVAYRLYLAREFRPFEYVKAARSILHGKEGSVYFDPIRDGKVLTFRPEGKPDYIGTVLDYGGIGTGRTTAVLTGAANRSKVTIHVRAVANRRGTLRVKRGDQTKSLNLSDLKPGPVEVDLGPSGPGDEIHLDAIASEPGKICYVCFTSVVVE